MDKYLEANRALWDEWTGINYRSEFYQVEAFKAGLNKPRPYEMEEVGSVEGKDLLHLQCHFGLDTHAGLRIDFLHEFPFVEWPASFLRPSPGGSYRLPPEHDGQLPLFFSLKATRSI